MKVAYIIPSLQGPSGWRSHAIGVLNAISIFVEPFLFVAKSDYEAANQLFEHWPIYGLPDIQGASASNLTGLRKLIATRIALASIQLPELDLIHSLEAYPTGLVGSWVAKRARCPHVLTAHGTYGVIWYERLIDRLLYQRVLENTRLVCPVSQGTADMMRRYFGSALVNAQVRPILNGSDFAQRVPHQVALGRKSPLVPTLLSVGDLKPRKGQHLSLEAFAQVKTRLPQARYYLAGSTSNTGYYDDLQRFVQDKQLKDVEFLGAVSPDELGQYYSQASAFVLTPCQEGLNFEGFGLVYLEAGAYGLPVVATRSGGVADAVRDGVTGLLVEPDDVAGVAEAIIQLLINPDLAHQMGCENRKLAESLTWERTAQEQFRAYQEILGTK